MISTGQRGTYFGRRQAIVASPCREIFRPTVYKFGGGILPGFLDQALESIEKGRPAHVVVSAFRGVTDALRDLFDNHQHRIQRIKILDACREQHLEALRRYGESSPEVIKEIDTVLDSVRTSLNNSDKLVAKGRLSKREAIRLDRERAFVMSRGEYLSALTLTLILHARAGEQTHQPRYSFWPSENGLRAKGSYQNAVLDAQRSISPPAGSIITGFYGMRFNPGSHQWEVRLLGRGGSDLTATFVGKLSGAHEVVLWKETAEGGILSADPRIIPEAKNIQKLGTRALYWASRLGAKVVFHGAIEPLIGTETVLRVASIHNGGSSTYISQDATTNDFVLVTGWPALERISISGAKTSDRLATLINALQKEHIVFAIVQNGGIELLVEHESVDAIARSLSEAEIRYMPIDSPQVALIGLFRDSGENGEAAGTEDILANILKLQPIRDSFKDDIMHTWVKPEFFSAAYFLFMVNDSPDRNRRPMDHVIESLYKTFLAHELPPP